MTETKTPKAGEYWVHKNSLDVVYFIGLAPSGQMVWQCAGDAIEIGDLDWSGWHHEPRCDSFDWQELTAVDPGEGYVLLPVGTAIQDGDEYGVEREQPVESPEDWVEISKTLHPDHVPRKGIDTLLHDHNPNSDAEGRMSVDDNDCYPTGHATWDQWKWVCRRKDLPDQVPVVKRMPVRLWVTDKLPNGDDDWILFVSASTPPAHRELVEIKHDADGFFVEVQA